MKYIRKNATTATMCVFLVVLHLVSVFLLLAQATVPTVNG